MSQSEVEALLAQAGSTESPAAGADAADDKNKLKYKSVQRYDFRKASASVLSTSEVRSLRLRHEEFISSLAARLSTYLRAEFHLQMSKLETVSFKQFVDNLGDPTHITLFNLEPLEGICLLEIPPRLALSIADRRAGGPGISNETRDLSPIEAGLLEQPADIILSELCGVWNGMLDLRSVLLGHETNGRFLQTSQHDTMMLIVAMEARFGDTVEQMQIGLPFCTLKPLVQKLNSAAVTDKKHEAVTAAVPPKWNHAFDDVKIRMAAVWPHMEITAKQLAQLRVGDLIPLNPRLASEIQMCLEKKPKFIGELGKSGKSWAVRVVSPLVPAR